MFEFNKGRFLMFLVIFFFVMFFWWLIHSFHGKFFRFRCIACLCLFIFYNIVKRVPLSFDCSNRISIDD